MNWWDTSERSYSAQPYGPAGGGIASFLPYIYQQRTGTTTSPLAEASTSGGAYSSPWSPQWLPNAPKQQPLPPGWMTSPIFQGTSQARQHNRGLTASSAAQNPWARGAASLISPLPGTSWGMNRWGQNWQAANVGGGNTAYAMGLGYPPPINNDSNQQVADPQKFYSDTGTSMREGANMGMERGQLAMGAGYDDKRRINMPAFAAIWGK